ncbi:cytochrome P450 [Nocardia sputi]|uniref:cytochrome P450 n=1 Tax=Nocardia sputi TaxID=2943705 RepID=UPI0020C0CCEA|nr:cytochrome P450 [Nocardia sputi]
MSINAIGVLDGESALRHQITRLSQSLRQVAPVEHAPSPRFVGYDTVRDADGATHSRKKAILMSGGCSVPTCTMCPFTNFNNFGRGGNADGLREQVASLLARTSDEPEYDMLALYNDGSFFARREVPLDVQLDIAGEVAATGVRRLVVESLPQFVTAETLLPFLDALGDVQLEVGIRLQSADRLVRETLVNTRITGTAFEAFRPQRFCGPEGARSAAGLLAFGRGAHACAGRGLAEAVTLLLAAVVLAGHRIDLVAGQRPQIARFQPVRAPAGSVQARIEAVRR